MKPLHYLFLAIVAAGFSSCFSLTEEIHLRADGSGDYKMYAEMDTSMDYSKLLGGLGSATTSDTTIKNLMSKLGGMNMDSLQNMMNEKTVEYSFSSIEDLSNFKNEIFKKREEMEKEKGKNGGSSDKTFEIAKIRTKMKLKNNVFTRSTKLSGGKSTVKEDNEVYKLLANAAKLKTIIYLPKKVKSVKGGTVVSREDKKVVLEYSLIDYMTGKTPDDFEIVME